MKSKMNNILFAIQALAAAVLFCAVKYFAPVCAKVLTLETGKTVPMKCHWTAQATVAVVIILLAVALMGILAKQDYKKFFVLTAVVGVVLFLVYTSLIGVCASPDMACNTTALWAKIVSGIVLVCSLVGLLGGKEGQIPN